MARTTLHHVSLPSSFWGEAIATSMYLLNCSLTKAVDDMIPKEVFMGNKLNVSHLHGFGCVAHVYAPSHKTRTLHAKSKTMISTRYASHSKEF